MSTSPKICTRGSTGVRSRTRRAALPVTLAVVGRSEHSRQHVALLMASFTTRVELVDHRVDSPGPLVEVVVLQIIHGDTGELAALAELAREPVAVVVMASVHHADLAERSLQLGARSWVSSDIGGSALATAVEAAAGRDRRRSVCSAGHRSAATRCLARRPAGA